VPVVHQVEEALPVVLAQRFRAPVRQHPAAGWHPRVRGCVRGRLHRADASAGAAWSRSSRPGTGSGGWPTARA